MKRKELCCFLAFVMLCQPMRVFSAETDAGAQTGTQKEVETQEEQPTVQSVLGEMTVGVDLLGGGINVTDIGSSPDSSDETDDAPGSAAKDPDEGKAEAEDGIKDNADGGQPDTVSGIREALGAPVGAVSLVEANKTREEYAKAYEDAKNANWGYTNLGIANVDNNLNIRAVPAEDGKLIGKLPKDAACEVIDSDGAWAHIQSGKVEGYVSCDYLITGVQAKHKAEELVSTVATVISDTLNVRAEASTDSEIITFVPKGEELEVVESEGEWVKVYLDDEKVYVFADFVQVDAKLNTAITMTELLYGQGVSDVRVDLCQYAKEFLGNPYVWGGTSLTKGADCSGYVLSIFKKYGVSLPHSSRAQANYGTKISLSDAKPGDLVFYGNGKYINHVAIYIGGGQVIHASSPKTGIRISNASYRTPIKVVRILQD